MPFTALNLDSEILKSLVESGYSKPTPIQENAIPQIMEGRDLLASAQTESGKTAAFILPALHRLKNTQAKPGTGPRVLILVPTRELAMQVATQAVKYSKYLSRVKTVCLYGGAPYPVQNRQLARPYEILVATPGRLIDQYENGRIDFSRVEMFVLDEADRMLDMGFISSVEQLISILPKEVQTVMFSATLEGDILRLSKKMMPNPVEINLASSKKKHENIEQGLYFADNLDHKLKLLEALLDDETIQQAIVFTSTKFFANELMHKLHENGHQVGVLHGDLNQRQRTNTIRQLREGKISILVATDVAARGIDIPAITHVINFDLPPNLEDYVHRIGRTGRADAKGIAVSLALVKDKRLVERIEQFTGKEINKLVIPGLEPTVKDVKAPKRLEGRRGRRPSDSKRGRSNSEGPRGNRFEEANRNPKPNYRYHDKGHHGSDQPARDNSFDRPLKEKSFDKPYKEKSFDRPFKEKSFDRPFKEKSFDRPFKEKSCDRPFKEKSFDRPFKDKSFDRPFKAKSFDRPFREKSFESKSKPSFFDDKRSSEFGDTKPRRSFNAGNKPRTGTKPRFSHNNQD